MIRPHRVDPLSREKAWDLARRFAICTAIASLFIYWLHPPLFERLDVKGRDLVFQLRQAPLPPADVLVVEVDEKSVKHFGRWPWPRRIQGRLISRLKEMSPSVIALDIVYPMLQSSEEDLALVRALQEPGAPVIGGYFFRTEQTIEMAEEAVERMRSSRVPLVLEKQEALHDNIAEYPFVEGNHILLAKGFEGFGFFNSVPDADGLIRSSPLLLRFEGDYYPSLALQALSVYYQNDIAIEVTREGVGALRLDERSLPVNGIGKMSLNFYNGSQRIAKVSASDILEGNVEPQTLKDKIVFVGVTEVGIADVRPTPIDHSFPGISIHATVAANVIQEYYLFHDNRTVLLEVFLMAALPLAMLWLMSFFDRPFYIAVIFLFTLGLVWVVFYRAVTDYGMLCSFFYPGIAVLFSYMTFELYEILVAQRRSRYIRRAFSSYVSPALVGKLINDPDSLVIKGERRNITVLFSDIRSFTSLSEAMEPEQLVRLLNLFLGPMTEVLMREHGTLDKYIGDAIMSIYNAPTDVVDHPSRAAATAVKMQRLLHKLNRRFSKEFGKTLRIGVGLNTGDAVVGNMGSARRFNYTAMGDTVNLASRLEGRTKYYGVEIIASKSTVEMLGPEYVTRRLDTIKVKGKDLPVEIFELLVHGRDSLTREMISRFHQALDLYLAGIFGEALAGFEDIMFDFPDDNPARIYAERSRYFLDNPPEEHWDGVFTATEK